MKIGIFDPYLDTLGGGERYMLTLAECLSKSNKVFVFWNDHSIIEKAEKKFGLDLKNVKMTKNVFSNTTKIYRFFATFGYDRIILLSDGSIPVLPAKKTFVHFQAPLKEENVMSTTKAKLKAIKAIIVNSYYTKKYIDQAFSRNSTVIYPPVEVDKFSNTKKKENIILTVGRYSRIPGGDFKKHTEMIKAFKDLVDAGLKGWKFHMVISHLPRDEEKVQGLINTVGNYPIKIVTKASNEEIIDLYEKSKIYWHAAGYGEDLHKNPDHAEHFGIAIVEAIAAGAVPVVFGAGGLKEIVEKGDVGRVWNNLNELKVITNELISNELLRREFIARGTKEAGFYSKDRFCKEVTELVK